MIVLSGASASGKTEVAKELASKYGITKMITTTTRKMRINEVNGRDYFFVSEEEFNKKINNGDFVEYTKYNNNYYGSTKDQISSDKCVVIDPSGLKAYVNLKDESIVTFFLESTPETRYKRMLLRGDSIKDAKARINNDQETFKRENVAIADFYINSETQTIEEVAKEVMNIYKSVLKERKLKKNLTK